MAAVKDIMKQCSYVLRPEWTLKEAAQTLAGHHVDVAPVVNKDGAVVGMITEDHLLDMIFDLPMRDAPVSDYMNQEFVLLKPSDPLSRAARLFAMYAFRRLPVAEEKTLVGIISRRDLIGHAIRSAKALDDPLVEFVPELTPVT